MKTRHREALKELGVTVRKYVVLDDGRVIYDDEDKPDQRAEVYLPVIWGIELWRERQETSLFIEHRMKQYGGMTKYILCTKQGDPSSDLSSFKRQQDAMAGAIGHWWTY